MRLDDYIAERDYIRESLCRAFWQMTEQELRCFLMHYVCGIEQAQIGRALGGITQQGVSFHPASAMRKAAPVFAAMRREASW